MIFVTVGHQMPFDRLVKVVDEWAAERGRLDVFAQIGDTDLTPRHIQFASRIAPSEFSRRVEQCRCIVGHAGMGTILTGLRHEKPVLVMPRRATLRETRNEHQLATARHLAGRQGIQVALDETALRKALDGVDELGAGRGISRHASAELLSAVQSFVEGASIPSSGCATSSSQASVGRRASKSPPAVSSAE